VRYRDRTIADVLAMTVDEASEFLADVTKAARSLTTLQEVGLGYLRLGQPTLPTARAAGATRLDSNTSSEGRDHRELWWWSGPCYW
jgi:excinuclease UvrABC ATPase subunit